MNLLLCILWVALIIFCVTSCNNSSASGLYHDSFNNSIELQSNGTVHYNQLNGNSLSCHSTGTWSKLDNNQLTISLEINSNCSLVSQFSGNWEIKDCYKYGQEESGCLVQNDYYFFSENKNFFLLILQ